MWLGLGIIGPSYVLLSLSPGGEATLAYSSLGFARRGTKLRLTARPLPTNPMSPKPGQEGTSRPSIHVGTQRQKLFETA